jgi:hypothetical protein
MDRLYRTLAGCGLVLTLVLPGSGCRSTKPEVPPSPTFSGNGQAPVGFSQSPNPIDGAAGLPPGGGVKFGTPNPSTSPSYGPAGNGGFGAVGANLGTPPSATLPGSAGLSSPPGASNPTTGIPQSGTGAIGPASGIGAAPTQSPF